MLCYRVNVLLEHVLTENMKYLWANLLEQFEGIAHGGRRWTETLIYDPLSSCFISPRNCPSIEGVYKIQGSSVQVVRCGIDEAGVHMARFLDLILRQSLMADQLALGNCMYSQRSALSLGGGVECWFGHFQKLVDTEKKLFLNIDTCSAVFHEPTGLVKVLSKLFTNINLMAGLSEFTRVRFSQFLAGLKFCICHRGEMRKRYRISGLTRNAAKDHYFRPTDQSPPQSVADYFAERYKRLQYPLLPCVIVSCGDGSKIFFPLEVCELLPGQRFNGRLDDDQTSHMIELTGRSPDERQVEITRSFNYVVKNSRALLDAYHVDMTDHTTMAPAQILSAPVVNFGNDSLVPCDGAWTFRGKKVILPACIDSWSVVFLGRGQRETTAKVRHFIGDLITTAEEMGIRVAEPCPDISICESFKFDDIKAALERSWKNAGKQANKQPQLIFCILANGGAKLYGNVKQICDTHLGVVSQCFLSSNLIKYKKQFLVNLLLKINVKVGGVNSSVPVEQMPYMSTESAMVIGVDLLKPIGNDGLRKTIVSMVASLDRNAFQYASTCRAQQLDSDNVSPMMNMYGEMICEYYRHNGCKPNRILIYRNSKADTPGSERNFRLEKQALRQACFMVDPEYTPKITYIIVDRQHHTRFFPFKSEDMDKLGNLLPGTVVDRMITRASSFEFYLCSHAGIRGTSKPTLYLVMHDDYGFSSNELQKLTFNLCFTYSRSNRSVSSSPPSYYAHLAALRFRFHYTSNGHGDDEASVPLRQNLLNTLYFL